MKILLVNYYYAPMVSAHAYRWTQLSAYWAKMGHEVHVICSSINESARENIVNNPSVVRVGMIRAKKIRSEQIHSRNGSTKQKYLAVAKNFLRFFYRKIYWPDGLWYWSFSVIGELIKRRSSDYDLVVSYSPSFTAHLAVLFFKKICRRDFYWIADYGDPFATSITMPNNNTQLFRRLNVFAESAVLKNASKVCFTSNNTYEDYCSAFGAMSNAYVIPHMADIADVYENTKHVINPAFIRLVFIGNFHKGIREPFLAAKIIEVIAEHLSLNNDTRVLFDIYGASNGVDLRSICSSVVTWHGPLDRSCTAKVIGEADFLVNIENTNCSMIPSKIVEYIATGKPIIDVAKTYADVPPLMASYAMEGKAMIMTDEYITELDSVLSFMRNYKGKGKISLEFLNEFLKDYGIEQISSKYLSHVINPAA
ncbi:MULTISPECIES: glycosyltransferase [unclassified Pseudomonas]|uniref:glycosyltransferase n=1 Tax=unclassified Pseudomonas TaxID=196821 RepID=UPI0039B77A24